MPPSIYGKEPGVRDVGYRSLKKVFTLKNEKLMTLMNKWYIRRDFSVAAAKMGKRGIALSSDVLASAVSAYVYGKNKNLDIRNGLIMMASVLTFTVVGSYIASLVPSTTMGGFSVFMTFLLGIKFIVKPVMTTKEAMQGVSAQKRAVQSVVCGVIIGFICGFIGAGGGMMMLLILTSVLGYELKTAVGTSVFIMTFTALTGALSHFTIGGAPDWTVFGLCVIFTLIWARIAALFANKAEPKTLNRATGIVLVVLGVVIFGFSILK